MEKNPQFFLPSCPSHQMLGRGGWVVGALDCSPPPPRPIQGKGGEGLR